MPPITARSWHWKWRLFVIVLIVVFYIELDLSEGSVSHPCWGKMLPNPTLCADYFFHHWRQIMAGVVSYSFASLPAELLELVCSFLNARYTSFPATIVFVNVLNAKYREVAWYITFPSTLFVLRDIAQLEAVSKDLRCRLNDGKVWQALARRVTHR